MKIPADFMTLEERHALGIHRRQPDKPDPDVTAMLADVLVRLLPEGYADVSHNDKYWWTVIGVYEDNELQTFVEPIKASSAAAAAIIAARKGPMSIVAVVPGKHPVISPEYAGHLAAYNSSDGLDEAKPEDVEEAAVSLAAMPPALTATAKIELIRNVIETAYKFTNSFERDGCGLSYLIQAIANGDTYDIHGDPDETEEAFLGLLSAAFPAETHPVWLYMQRVD